MTLEGSFVPFYQFDYIQIKSGIFFRPKRTTALQLPSQMTCNVIHLSVWWKQVLIAP
jgi:hypothetical protein